MAYTFCDIIRVLRRSRAAARLFGEPRCRPLSPAIAVGHAAQWRAAFEIQAAPETPEEKATDAAR
jgi:hypothetical protein